MQLRKLEISGFKSFMSRLELDFSGGVTAIIGPNGCGKSNVVDSIRWVLGEQRTRMLRNTKMENVLFNGTRLRKPLGMAEVFLTLDNQDHRLNSEYGQVKIGRRLYRSGVSEYLVNGQPVRLKDIRGLLTDTGLGNSVYAIIERNMIDSVLSEKEDEKRNLLEEAAGVMRYRLQREEAERKIKATEQDLLRLVDILNELDKELRSLKYQMGKARRYQALKEEADTLESALLKATLYELLLKRDELTSERESHENVRLVGDNEIAISESRLQEMRVESAELEKSLQDMHELRFQTSTALQQHDERVAIHTERVSQSRARVADDEAEISRARTRLESVGAELEIDRGNAAARREAAHASRTLLADRESALRESNGALESARDALRKHKQLALDLVREQAREKGALEQIEVTLADLTRRQDAVESQLDDLSGEETRRVADLRSIEERVAVQQATLASKQEGLARLIHRLEQTSEELMECDRAISDSSIEIAKLTDKHDFLRRIHDEHTRTADELRGHGALAGVLSDLVRVEKKYRKCFEACLAPILKSVVAGSRRDAVNWLRSYRGGEAGSVQILFPDQFVSGGARAAGDEIIGTAAELIDCDPQVSTYLIAYLEGVVVVENVEAALSVIEKGLAARVATLDGVFFDGPGRVLVAGSEDIDSTMLEMRSKLDELNRSIVSAAALEKDAHQKRDAIMAARERMQDEMVSLRTALAADEKVLEGVMESRRDAELHLIRVKEKITALETAIAETRDTMLVLKPKLESSRRTAEMPDAAAGLDSADLSALEEKAIAAERERERLLEEVNSMRLEQLSAANEAETAETRVRNAETLVQELNDLVRAREEDLKRAEEQIRLSTEDMAATREAVAKLHAEKREVEARIEHANERYTAAKAKRDEVEAEIHAMKDQREIKRANIERVNVEMAGVETRIAGVVEKAREKFGRDM